MSEKRGRANSLIALSYFSGFLMLSLGLALMVEDFVPVFLVMFGFGFIFFSFCFTYDDKMYEEK